MRNFTNHSSRKFDKFRFLIYTMWVVVGLAVIGTVGVSIYSFNVLDTASNCTVDDKDRTTTKDGNSDMRVYTSCGVFNVGDDLFTGRFDSADRYASIEVGKTYNFETRGVRFPFLSLFPNILEVK